MSGDIVTGGAGLVIEAIDGVIAGIAADLGTGPGRGGGIGAGLQRRMEGGVSRTWRWRGDLQRSMGEKRLPL